jgi:hypothetical protein
LNARHCPKRTRSFLPSSYVGTSVTVFNADWTKSESAASSAGPVSAKRPHQAPYSKLPRIFRRWSDFWNSFCVYLLWDHGNIYIIRCTSTHPLEYIWTAFYESMLAAHSECPFLIADLYLLNSYWYLALSHFELWCYRIETDHFYSIVYEMSGLRPAWRQLENANFKYFSSLSCLPQIHEATER